jgi:photosystem II stability/assembly factor-like uncharacterized protein
MQQQDILPIGGIPFADLYDIAHTSAIYTDQTTACIPCEGDVNFVLRQYKPLPSCTFNFTPHNVSDEGGPVPPTRLWTGVASSGNGQYLAAISALTEIPFWAPYVTQVFVSNDYGVTWINPLNRVLIPWTSITMNTINTAGKYMAVCRTGEIYVSSNYGLNWSLLGGAPNYPWTSISYASDGSYLVAGATTNSNIWFSTDHGANWTPLPGIDTLQNWSDIAIVPFFGTFKGVGIADTSILLFNAGGVTLITSGLGTHTWRAVACDSQRLFIFVVSSTGQIIIKSTDSGVTWQDCTPAPSLNWSDISVSSDGTKIFACAEGGQLYKSTDEGATWIALDSSRQWTGVTSSSDGEKLAAVDYGTLPNGGYIYTGACT